MKAIPLCWLANIPIELEASVFSAAASVSRLSGSWPLRATWMPEIYSAADNARRVRDCSPRPGLHWEAMSKPAKQLCCRRSSVTACQENAWIRTGPG